MYKIVQASFKPILKNLGTKKVYFENLGTKCSYSKNSRD